VARPTAHQVSFQFSSDSRRIFTVSELTHRVRETIDATFPDVWVEGEISNLKMPTSGHVYFTLKDEGAQVRAVLFRAQAQRLRFQIREGLTFVVRGRLTVYEPRGDYQLILDSVEPKGIGALQLALEQLKERLAQEGLFEESRKRPLPFLPRCVGVVTSSSGAAIRDMLVVMHRRCPIIPVILNPVRVQGEGAGQEIAQAIRWLSTSGLVDVMIVGRGGGSMEDLWAFNEEVVVRAIAASRVPVVSAVGHEVDITLADLVADRRAPTPSAAAEAVTPILDELTQGLEALWRRCSRAMRLRQAGEQQRLEMARYRLPVIGRRVQQQMQLMDEWENRMEAALGARLVYQRVRLREVWHQLGVAGPGRRVGEKRAFVGQFMKRAERGILGWVAIQRQTFLTSVSALQALSPLAILARGYSVLLTVPEGRTVRQASQVHVGDELRARLAQGELRCLVQKVADE
jgi:exodeoxyribonuclease VII large subunit